MFKHPRNVKAKKVVFPFNWNLLSVPSKIIINHKLIRLCCVQQMLDMSSCQNVSHVGLSSLTSGAASLRQLILAYGFPVSPLSPFPINMFVTFLFFI